MLGAVEPPKRLTVSTSRPQRAELQATNLDEYVTICERTGAQDGRGIGIGSLIHLDSTWLGAPAACQDTFEGFMSRLIQTTITFQSGFPIGNP